MSDLGKLLREDEEQAVPDLSNIKGHWSSMRSLLQGSGIYYGKRSWFSYTLVISAVLGVCLFVLWPEQVERKSMPANKYPPSQNALDTAPRILVTDPQKQKEVFKAAPALSFKRTPNKRLQQKKTTQKDKPVTVSDSIHAEPQHPKKRRARTP